MKAVLQGAQGNGGAGYLTTSLVSISGGGSSTVKASLQTEKKGGNFVRFTGGSGPLPSMVFSTAGASASEDRGGSSSNPAAADTIGRIRSEAAAGTPQLDRPSDSIGGNVFHTMAAAADSESFSTSDDGGMMFSTT